MATYEQDEFLSAEEAMAVVRDKQALTRRKLNANVVVFGAFGVAVLVAVGVQAAFPHMPWIAPAVWGIFVLAYLGAWTRLRAVQRAFGLNDHRGPAWAVSAAMMSGCFLSVSQFHGMAAARGEFVVLAGGLGLLAWLGRSASHAVSAAWLAVLAGATLVVDAHWQGWLWAAAAAGYLAVSARAFLRPLAR
jgi:hypothetical protein